MEQLKTIGRELAMGSQAGFGQSKEFLDLVKSIGEARSKSEEDRIILREIETLKRRISDPDVSKSRMKEYVIRLVYIEMLGHDASFGHIHAVKMTHDDNLLFKRTGYLAVTLLLDEDHDLIILIVNTMQKDLKSDNYLVVCAALNAVSRLINEETIPAVLAQVVELLGHQKEAVRKKAIMVLHRFYQKSPGSVSHLVPNFRKRLCDSDPGVMGATLCPLFDLITIDVNSYKDLVVSFVSILKQVTERRLPKTYDYHQMPAPFIQIKLLKILALLGAGDRGASEHMYTIIGDIIRKCDSATNIGNAVLYECVCCVSCLYPNKKSLEAAADATSKLLKSDSHNLKYMGIDALSRLVSMSSDIAEQHQLAVIDCLEDPDDTLKRKTFELLYKMTKSSNVEVIVDHMIDYMINITDNHYKTEIATRCVELAEQFAPSNQWFIQTMNRVFEHAGDLVNVKVAHNLMRLIAEGLGENDGSADSQLRSSAVESYLHIIAEPKLPSMFLQVICWVLGEYGTTDGKHSASYISGKLCDIAEAYSHDETIKAYAITAMMKLYAFEIAAGRKVDMIPECQCFIEDLAASHSTDLQQRAYELRALMELDAQTVEGVMPVDASCEDIEVDKSLSFLDSFVQEALQKGAQPYIPQNERSSVGSTDYRTLEQLEASTHGLRFEAYELPKPSPYLKPKVPSDSNLSSSAELVPIPEFSSSMNRSASVSSLPASGSGEVKLRLDGVQKKWGRPTYTSESSTTQSSEIPGTSNKKNQDGSSDLRKTQVEITPEKQKLAASLFGTGGSSGLEKKPPLASQRSSKTSSVQQPPPDLLDLDGSTCPITATSNTYSSPDPMKQLEGLLNQTENTSTTMLGNANVSAEADIMSLYSGMPFGGQTSRDSIVQGSTHLNKGPNVTESLKKDALARQVGVNPTSQNPNLFKDLLQ